MISDLVLAVGLIAVIEGLVLALAPLRFEDLLEWLRGLDPQTRRTIGLAMICAGVGLVWLSKNVFG